MDLMDATQLSRWTRFAAKGGIGKGTAIQDCVAEQAEDLMFLKVRTGLHTVCPRIAHAMSRATRLPCSCNLTTSATYTSYVLVF